MYIDICVYIYVYKVCLFQIDNPPNYPTKYIPANIPMVFPHSLVKWPHDITSPA